MRENKDEKGRRARRAARVLSKVEVHGPLECWLWRGHIDENGYGRVSEGRTKPSALAHRVIYRLLVGDIASETLDHLCRNRSCVNPTHLEEVTMNENWRRGESLTAQNARKTACVNGHPFTPENTYWKRRGTRMGRECRTCRRAQMKKWRETHAA